MQQTKLVEDQRGNCGKCNTTNDPAMRLNNCGCSIHAPISPSLRFIHARQPGALCVAYSTRPMRRTSAAMALASACTKRSNSGVS